jgi:hypothetical protein
MSEDKLSALKNLIDTPKDLHKLKIYEGKFTQACTNLLFDSRKIIINSETSSKSLAEAARIIPQIRTRVESLIDRARRQELRIRPGTPEKKQKLMINNSLLFDFIIFSRGWDLKEELKELDSLLVFGEVDKIKDLAKEVLEHIQTIDELFSQKEHAKTNIQSSEEVAAILLERFDQEMAIAEQAGALKGILKLEKPKFLGKDKYYDQLGNIILKIAMSFDLETDDTPIAIRAINAILNREFPRVKADLRDILKAVEILDENGLLILKQDHEGLYWIQLSPSESEANIILRMAELKGFLTIEEVVMETNWPLEKATEEMEKFVKAGCAIRDTSYSTGTKYYFPGLSEESTDS